MEFLGADADFSPKAKLGAVGKAGAGIDINCAGINLVQEAVSGGLVFGYDRVGVTRTVGLYVSQRIVQGEMPPLARTALDQMVADLAELANQRPLRHDPVTAAKLLWAGGLGAATFIAGEAMGGVDDPGLGEVMLDALLASL